MWKDLIEDLKRNGFVEEDIAKRIREKGISTTQATVNRVKNGVTKKVDYGFGLALKAVHQELCTPKKRTKTEART